MMQKQVLPLLLILFALAACQPASPTPTPTLEAPPASPFPTLSEDETLLFLAGIVVHSLEARDMAELSLMVHPEMGLRFSPYAFVRGEDLVFTAEQVAGLLDDAMVYTWGVFDGSGEPIEMAFAEYFERFVFDQNYTLAEDVSLNERLGQGNTLDNALEFYPGASVVESHFPGFDPAYVGLDWRSLRLVFQPKEGEWFLVGIIHDEWTI